jgi:hypothetical protein
MLRAVFRRVPASAAAGALVAAALSAAAFAAPAVAAPALPAAASGALGWRITEQAPATVQFNDIAAASSSGAFATGFQCNATCTIYTLLLWHWSAGAWHAVPAPHGYANQGSYIAGDVVAPTSASAAWVFANPPDALPSAIYWTGQRWNAPVHFPGDSQIFEAVANGPSDVWAFGLIQTTTSRSVFVLHYNGTRWSRVTAPLVVLSTQGASAVSASDIWAAGEPANPTGCGSNVVVARWNGTSWKLPVQPHVHVPAGDELSADAIAAVSPDSVWLDGSLSTCRGAELSTVVWHWNGKTWSQVRFPYPATGALSFAQDGHGGVWLAPDTNPGSDWVAHYSDGSWTRDTIPNQRGYAAELSMLTWIPGTRSEWGYGQEVVGSSGTGSFHFDIYKYGP